MAKKKPLVASTRRDLCVFREYNNILLLYYFYCVYELGPVVPLWYTHIHTHTHIIIKIPFPIGLRAHLFCFQAQTSFSARACQKETAHMAALRTARAHNKYYYYFRLLKNNANIRIGQNRRRRW